MLFQVQERLTATFCNEQEVETGNEPSSTARVSKYQQEKFILAHVYRNSCIAIGKRGTVMVYRDHAYQNKIITLSPLLHARNAHPSTHMTV